MIPRLNKCIMIASSIWSLSAAAEERQMLPSSLLYEGQAGEDCLSYGNQFLTVDRSRLNSDQSLALDHIKEASFPYVYIEFKYRAQAGVSENTKLSLNGRNLDVRISPNWQFFERVYRQREFPATSQLKIEGGGNVEIADLKIRQFSYCKPKTRLCTRVDRAVQHAATSKIDKKQRGERVLRLPYTLGSDESLILRSRRMIPNLPGSDLSFEVAGASIDLEIYVSHWAEGPWNLVSHLKSSQNVDITPLARARFIKISNWGQTIKLKKLTCLSLP